MRFRATWAALLTAMILSLSSVASACEIRCDLESTARGCHHVSGVLHENHSTHMGRMRNMDRSSMRHDAAATHESAAMSAARTCRRQACVQRPALPAGMAAAADAPVLSLVAILLTSAAVRSALGSGEYARGSPPPAKSSPKALHTILRV